MKTILFLITACLYAETPQQKADSAWLKKYHQLTAKVRKAQQERDELIKAKMVECESRGGQLLQDRLLEPTCQPKPPQPLPPPPPPPSKEQPKQ